MGDNILIGVDTLLPRNVLALFKQPISTKKSLKMVVPPGYDPTEEPTRYPS